MTIGVHAAARIYRWTDRQRIDLIAPQRAWLTSVNIRIDAGASNTITVGLEMSYDEGVRQLEEDVFDRGNVLEARVGYAEGNWFTPWYSGICGAPSIKLNANGLTGTLTASGVGASALVNASGRSWDGYTVFAALEEVANKHGFAINMENVVRERLEVPCANVQQSGLNDWFWLRTELRYAAHDMWFGANTGGKATLFVRAYDQILKETPKRVFAMARQINMANNQFPIIDLEIKSDASAVFNTAATRGVFAQFLDNSGNVVEIKSDPKRINELEAALGRGSVQTGTGAGAVDPVSGVRQDIGVQDGDDQATGMVIQGAPEGKWQEHLDAVARDATMGFPGMEIAIKTIGNPEILPYELQEVVGASRRFDGKYLVHAVVHDVGSGGFETTWEGRRNAFNLPLEGGPENMTVNEQEPA